MKVFVDGSEGTTGLRIAARLNAYQGIECLMIDADKRKDPNEKRRLLNEADVAILCLPDDAARESVSLIDNPRTKVLDTSTAHRTMPDWAYGFAELSSAYRERLTSAMRVSVPGCHASGFIALAKPLVDAGVVDANAVLSCHSITGYSGGGKKMIAEYEQAGLALKSPRQYGLTQNHKHLKEMALHSGLANPPVFSPIVSNFYAGMVVSIPLSGIPVKRLNEIYRDHYQGQKLIRVLDDSAIAALNGFLPADALSGKDDMELIVCGNDDRAVVCARFDNLGKGSSGAALQCLNLMLGEDEIKGLAI